MKWMMGLGLLGLGIVVTAHRATGATFTPLVPLRPKVVNTQTNVPGGNFAVGNLFDGNPKTEYASRDEGTNTLVELDFGAPRRIVAIQHVDRNDSATVAESELLVLDADGKQVNAVTIAHANRRNGNTFLILPWPVEVQRAKWHITKQGNKGLFSLGGAELVFFTSEPTESRPQRDTVEGRVLPFVDKQGHQPLKVTIQHPYAEAAHVNVLLPDQSSQAVTLKSGANEFEWPVPQVTAPTERKIGLQYDGQNLTQDAFTQAAARQVTIYILPHSHTDIGYTEIQTAIENKQVKNVMDGILAAQKTADYPAGARFVWNVEVGWAADLFLQRMDESKRAMFFEAVKKGQITLNGMYLNELTGLCRPEELVQLFRFATQMSRQTGVPVDSAMISDVPGYTWGTVPAMAQAGIRYLSAAPNYFDRIGNILEEWENKPFYWQGPDGRSKVLVWIPFWGYAMSHIYHELSPKLVDDFYKGLEKKKYPHDIAYVRWAGHGDNAVPDPAICDFVRDWNAKYEWPKFIISGTSAAFRALEERYGDKIPTVRGDWTPYWEDGAGSSALETAQNRASSDRLGQAATAFALRQDRQYPAPEFATAWRNVLLYSEHTWGAWCSVSEPERKETLEQWAIKKSYADHAAAQSHALLAQALNTSVPAKIGSLEVLNTLSWERNELVTLSRAAAAAGDRVTDAKGKPTVSQRLASGELVFLATDVPALAAKQYTISKGDAAKPRNAARAEGTVLENGLVRVRVDDKTGAIVELSARGIPVNLADAKSDGGLNSYLYVIADDPRQARSNGPVKISIGEKGPLVASLIIESSAPGCKSLRRELRLAADDDAVFVINTVDKERLAARSYSAHEGKESVNFAFPFNVPDGDLWFDVPFGVVRADEDQIPSACKNWLTVGRWAEVANDDYGVTCVTLDAPLIQPGYLSATLLNSQTNPRVWRKSIAKTQKFYSWAMNNHWGTNYRAYQDGPTVFRFVLRPHRRKLDPAATTRSATALSQPLLVVSSGSGFNTRPLFTVDSPEVIVAGLKPADDGKALIIRLWETTGKERRVKLNWGETKPQSISFSDTSEQVGSKVDGKIAIPPHGLVTLRAEL